MNENLLSMLLQGNARRQPRSLVTIEAGMMTGETLADGSGVRLIPDARRGMLSLYSEGNQKHWVLMDVFSGNEIKQGYIPTSGASFRRIKSPKDEDRIYELKYGAGNQRHFFWLQGSDESKDKTNIEKFLTHTGRTSDTGAATAARRGAPAARPQDAGNRRLLEQALQQAMSSFATPAAPQAPAPATSTEAASAPAASPTPAAESETAPLLGENRTEGSGAQAGAPSTTTAEADDIEMLQLQEFEDLDPEEAAMLAEAIRLSQQQGDSTGNSGSGGDDSQNQQN